MNSQKIVLKETAIIACGELICSALMVVVYAALGMFRFSVLWSALAGSGIMVLNYLFMSIAICLAADRAERGEVETAKKSVQLSSVVRLICIGIALFIAIRLGADVIALVLPLAFTRPILMICEFFGKKGDNGRN